MYFRFFIHSLTFGKKPISIQAIRNLVECRLHVGTHATSFHRLVTKLSWFRRLLFFLLFFFNVCYELIKKWFIEMNYYCYYLCSYRVVLPCRMLIFMYILHLHSYPLFFFFFFCISIPERRWNIFMQYVVFRWFYVYFKHLFLDIFFFLPIFCQSKNK